MVTCIPEISQAWSVRCVISASSLPDWAEAARAVAHRCGLLARCSVLARSKTSWREAVLRAGYVFRLWRNEVVRCMSSVSPLCWARWRRRPPVPSGPEASRFPAARLTHPTYGLQCCSTRFLVPILTKASPAKRVVMHGTCVETLDTRCKIAFVPPEAETIVGTKHSFAPARYTVSARFTTRQP